MGLKGYFKNGKKDDKPAPNAAPEMIEKGNVAPQPSGVSTPGPYGNGSGRGSYAPSVTSQKTSGFMEEIRHEVMVNYLFQQQCSKMWIGDGTGQMEGIMVRKAKGSYLACPPQLTQSVFAQGILAINPHSAMTVNSRVIKTFLSWSPDATDVPLRNGLRVQVLPTMDELPKARKHQFAAFIASEGLLVVWDDEANNLIPRAKAIESDLMHLVWKAGEPEREEEDSSDEKKGAAVVAEEIDPESGEVLPEKRATHLQNTVLVSLTIILVVVMLGAGFRQIAIAISVDQNYLRIAFLLLTPIQVFFTLVS